MSFNYLKFLDSHFRCCARCGLFYQPTDCYCTHCWQQLIALVQPGSLAITVNNLRFTVNFLFEWNKCSDSLLRPLIYALKGQKRNEAFAYFATKLHLSFPLPPLASLVAAPGLHAQTLAEQLAITYNQNLSICLRKANADAQKNRSALARKSITIEPTEPSLLTPRPRCHVFVDDIFTTGATAAAAYQSLGCPTAFEVWVIAYKTI